MKLNIPPFVPPCPNQDEPTRSPGTWPGPYTLSRERLLLFFCYSHILHCNTRSRWEERSTAKEHVRRLLLTHLHYRLFNQSLYLAVLHPVINHIFDPLIQPVKLPWFPLQELLLRRKNTQVRVYTNSLEISWNITLCTNIAFIND